MMIFVLFAVLFTTSCEIVEAKVTGDCKDLRFLTGSKWDNFCCACPKGTFYHHSQSSKKPHDRWLFELRNVMSTLFSGLTVVLTSGALLSVIAWRILQRVCNTDPNVNEPEKENSKENTVEETIEEDKGVIQTPSVPIGDESCEKESEKQHYAEAICVQTVEDTVSVKMESHLQRFGVLDNESRNKMLRYCARKARSQGKRRFGVTLKKAAEKFLHVKLNAGLASYKVLCWEVVKLIPEDKWMRFVRLHLNLKEEEIQRFKRKHASFNTEQRLQISQTLGVQRRRV